MVLMKYVYKKRKTDEDTTISASNNDVHIYGDILAQTNDDSIISELNESVVARVSEKIIRTYSYDDYGKSSAKSIGHGYNREVR